VSSIDGWEPDCGVAVCSCFDGGYGLCLGSVAWLPVWLVDGVTQARYTEVVFQNKTRELMTGRTWAVTVKMGNGVVRDSMGMSRCKLDDAGNGASGTSSKSDSRAQIRHEDSQLKFNNSTQSLNSIASTQGLVKQASFLDRYIFSSQHSNNYIAWGLDIDCPSSTPHIHCA
jgi:hypothetical protein